MRSSIHFLMKPEFLYVYNGVIEFGGIIGIIAHILIRITHKQQYSKTNPDFAYNGMANRVHFTGYSFVSTRDF